MLKIAHLVNPVNLPPPSDLVIAQPLVFEAMRIARMAAADVADVTLLAACYPEDSGIVPNWMTLTAPLTRSILDLQSFEVRRKLPLIADLIERLITTVPDADAYIYSNVDIIVTPQIYRFVAHRFADGCDALTINRTSVADRPYVPADLPLIWAEPGEESAGYDFFVFTRAMAERFVLGETIIGISWIGTILHFNLLTFARRHEKLHHQQLTKHVGDQSGSAGRSMQPYREHNQRQYQAIAGRLGWSEAFYTANYPAANLSRAFVERQQQRKRNERRCKQQQRWAARLSRLWRLLTLRGR
jgi:hypothetical protein